MCTAPSYLESDALNKPLQITHDFGYCSLFLPTLCKFDPGVAEIGPRWERESPGPLVQAGHWAVFCLPSAVPKCSCASPSVLRLSEACRHFPDSVFLALQEGSGEKSSVASLVIRDLG